MRVTKHNAKRLTEHAKFLGLTHRVTVVGTAERKRYCILDAEGNSLGTYRHVDTVEASLLARHQHDAVNS